MPRRWRFPVAWLAMSLAIPCAGCRDANDWRSRHVQRYVGAQQMIGEWRLRGVSPSDIPQQERNRSVDVLQIVRGFYIAEDEGGRLVLWNYLGDPDARRYVEYVRDGAERRK
jgi:hypothetical protein